MAHQTSIDMVRIVALRPPHQLHRLGALARQIVDEALATSGGNLTHAAASLGLSYRTITRVRAAMGYATRSDQSTRTVIAEPARKVRNPKSLGQTGHSLPAGPDAANRRKPGKTRNAAE